MQCSPCRLQGAQTGLEWVLAAPESVGISEVMIVVVFASKACGKLELIVVLYVSEFACPERRGEDMSQRAYCSGTLLAQPENF